MVPRRYRGHRFLRASAQGSPSRQKTPLHARHKRDNPNISLSRSRKWAFSGRVENNFLALDDPSLLLVKVGGSTTVSLSGYAY
jgi:hypothetical protein